MELNTFKIRIDKFRNLLRNFIKKMDEFIELKDLAFILIDEVDKLEYDVKKQEIDIKKSKNFPSLNKKKSNLTPPPPILPPQKKQDFHVPIKPPNFPIIKPKVSKKDDIIMDHPLKNLQSEMLKELARLKELMKT